MRSRLLWRATGTLVVLIWLATGMKGNVIAAGPPIRLLGTGPHSLRILFVIPPYRLHRSTAGCTQVLFDGREPGQLPQFGALFEIPSGESIAEVRVLKAQSAHLSVGQSVCETAPPTMADAPEPQEMFSPSPAVSVKDMGWVRNHHLGRVLFRPVSSDPTHHKVTLTRRMLISIHFAPTDVRIGARYIPPSPPIEAVLSKHMLNHVRAAPQAAPIVPSASDDTVYKVFVAADGLYRLTCAQLDDAGLPTDALDPSTLQLFEGEREVDILVEGDQDGRCDPDDSLLFYGRAPHSRYTDQNVYWLRYGHAPGRRMAARDVTPGTQPAGTLWATARYEENRFYDPRFVAADGDHWYAADLRPGVKQQVTLHLQPVDTGVATATLQVRVVGYTADVNVNPDHHLNITVNGHLLGGQWWEGAGAVTLTLAVSSTLLVGGDNMVTISMPGDTGAAVEGTWLDAVEMLYPLRTVDGGVMMARGMAGTRRYEVGGWHQATVHLLDVTDPRRPTLLQGAVVGGSGSYTLTFADAPTHTLTYLAAGDDQVRTPLAVIPYTPTNLTHLAAGADYLIVTHPLFREAIRPLVDRRQAQGWRVAVVEVQDVYDEFSNGRPDPEAIRKLIAAVMPTFALLVGDGHYDFLDHYGYGNGNYIPPYLTMADPWWGETAADNRYAAVVGDDLLPDVLIGRLPVNTPTEAETVVAKILSYEESPLPGDWNARHVFVADEGGRFAASADAVYNSYVHPPAYGERIYLDDMSPDEARRATLAAWGRGALLMSFLGHASWHQWSEENLFNINELSTLHNDRRWPVVLSMTCFTGFFHHPEYPTLDESLLRLAGGGAVATWSPSGLGVDTGHDYLFDGFYRAVFKDGQTQLGQATLAGRLSLYANAPAYADLVDTYHLFGDPAMSLNLTIRPWPYVGYLPLVLKGG